MLIDFASQSIHMKLEFHESPLLFTVKKSFKMNFRLFDMLNSAVFSCKLHFVVALLVVALHAFSDFPSTKSIIQFTFEKF